MLIRPFALTLIEALEAIGIFSRSGLQATNDIWRDVDFVANEHIGHVRDLSGRLAERLDAEGLVTPTAASEHARWFHHHWQMPMYNLDFALVPASLEELRADREAALWAEIGWDTRGDY